mgnify:CR=1 FL=1
MLSNYPPGVTGNEFQISGPDFEQEVDQECLSDTQVVPVSLFDEMWEYVRKYLVPDDDREHVLDKLEMFNLLRSQSETEGTCGFEGEALTLGYRGNYWWTCPACGAEHE